MHPGFIYFGVNILSVMFYLQVNKIYFKNYLSRIIYLDVRDQIVKYIIYILIFIIGSLIGEKVKIIKSFKIQTISLKKIKLLYKIGINLGKVVFVIQLLWVLMSIILSKGMLLKYFLSFNVYGMKKILYSYNLPGVTTLTLLSNTAVIFYSIAYFYCKRVRNYKKSRFKEWFILLFPSFLRGIFFSERLAIYENLISIILIYLYFYLIKKSKVKFLKIIVQLFLFLFLMFLLFSIAESKRSYSHYNRIGLTNNIFHWGFIRLSNYFITSLDTGLKILKYYEGEYLITSNLFHYIPNSGSRVITNFLNKYSHLEYNTFTAIGSLYFDLKNWATIYLFGLGLVFGNIYQMYIKGEIIGLIIYPTIFVGILESYRLYYYGFIRFPLVIMGTILTYIIFIKKIKGNKK